MVPPADPLAVDPDFAVGWYAGWIEAWNDRKPELIPGLVTEDFLLGSPTTRHTGWHVQGHAATADYLKYVIDGGGRAAAHRHRQGGQAGAARALLAGP